MAPPRKPPQRDEQNDNGDEDTKGSIAQRLWQVEERQHDVRRRLVRVEDAMQQLARNIEAQSYQLARLGDQVEELRKQRQAGAGLLGDNTLLRALAYGVVALALTLAALMGTPLSRIFG